MFEHSEKPPRQLKEAAKILKRVRLEGGSVKRFIEELPPRKCNRKTLYVTLSETIALEKKIDELFAKIDLFEIEPRLDPWLSKVLLVEFLYGRMPKGTSKPVMAVKKYYLQHKQEFDSLKENLEEKKVIKPRYVRVNTLRTTTSDVIKTFQDDGWNFIRCTSGSYDDYLKQLQNLGEFDFITDYHVKVVFAFAPQTRFQGCSAYDNGEIFLQDKATCLPAYILSPTPGSTILDLCAAPGMKSTHLASLIKNEGTIYSIEKDEKRCETLKQFVKASGATCIQVMSNDATAVTKTHCPNVDYVLVDPSCSGSGMDRVAGNDVEYDIESGRLQKLSAFQAKLLRHTLNEFGMAKRIVYSTCSLYPQENEEVIADVVKNHKGKFQLVSALEKLNFKWNNAGDMKYKDIGEKCLYALPDSDYTCGFFIAVFEKSEDSLKDVKLTIENDEKTGLAMNVDSDNLDIEKTKKKSRKSKINDKSSTCDDIPKKKSKTKNEEKPH